MNGLKPCFRCKSRNIDFDCQPDIGISLKINDRYNCVVYCEDCGIQTKTYESDNLGGIYNARLAAIEDWNKDY